MHYLLRANLIIGTRGASLRRRTRGVALGEVIGSDSSHSSLPCSSYRSPHPSHSRPLHLRACVLWLSGVFSPLRQVHTHTDAFRAHRSHLSLSRHAVSPFAPWTCGASGTAALTSQPPQPISRRALNFADDSDGTIFQLSSGSNRAGVAVVRVSGELQ